jgi:hypothetical protein
MCNVLAYYLLHLCSASVYDIVLNSMCNIFVYYLLHLYTAHVYDIVLNFMCNVFLYFYHICILHMCTILYKILLLRI